MTERDINQWISVTEADEKNALRDRFAGAALTGLLAGGFTDDSTKRAYQLADAMLADRMPNPKDDGAAAFVAFLLEDRTPGAVMEFFRDACDFDEEKAERVADAFNEFRDRVGNIGPQKVGEL